MLDVKTVAITYFVTSLMLTVVMTVLWLQNRKQFNGILFLQPASLCKQQDFY